jgi:hypothetical protein
MQSIQPSGGKIGLMEVSRYRRAELHRRLTRGLPLLLPADPGPAAMLDAVRAVNPAAKRILPHRIQVDGRSQFYLSRPYRIDAELRRQARLPDDITVAYFVRWVADSDQDAASYREQATRLLDALAAGFGGRSGPGRAGQGESPGQPAGQSQPPGEAESPGEAAGPADPTTVERGVTKRANLVRIVLLFLCTVVFFGFAAANGTAAAWPLLALNALMGLFFAAATLLLLGRHLGRR